MLPNRISMALKNTRITMVGNRRPRPILSQIQPMTGLMKTAMLAKTTRTMPALTGLIPLPFTIRVLDQVTKP